MRLADPAARAVRTATLALLAAASTACSEAETAPDDTAPVCERDPTPFEAVVSVATVTTMDTSCVGQAATVDCTLQVCGRTRRILFDTPLVDVTLEAFDADDQLLTQTTSDGDGHYCMSLPPSPSGFAGRIRASAPDRRAHDAYFGARPLIASTDLFDLGLEEEAVIADVLPTFGLPPSDPSKGIVDPIFTDCAGASVAGLAFELDQPYEARAYINDQGEIDATATQSVSGQLSGALFVNVDPGPFVVTVTDAASGDLVTQCAGEARALHWTAVACRPH